MKMLRSPIEFKKRMLDAKHSFEVGMEREGWAPSPASADRRTRRPSFALHPCLEGVLGVEHPLLDIGLRSIFIASESGIDAMKMLRSPIEFKKRMLDAKHDFEVGMEREGWAPSPPVRAGGPVAAGDGAAAQGTPRSRLRTRSGPGAAIDPDEVTRTLASLADLRDRGAITPEEYEAKKADLLGTTLSRRDRSAASGRRGALPYAGPSVAKVPIGSRHSRSRHPGGHRRRDHAARRRCPVHEFSHALAAYRLGDGTAKLFGRLTLNPIAHFDPVGGTLLALTFIGSAATGRLSASAGPSRHRSTR